MTHPHVTALAERTMTHQRIPGQATARRARPPATPAERPPVVCLCGSTRFVDEFNRQRTRLTCDGQIVLSIEIVTTQSRASDPQHADPALKARLDELHLRKIDLADYILVLNVGGYTGPSTRNEIAYAHSAGKPVRYLDPPEPGPGEWACTRCSAAWYGTPPESGTCPGGCQPAAWKG
jgi:hypothetical protein